MIKVISFCDFDEMLNITRKLYFNFFFFEYIQIILFEYKPRFYLKNSHNRNKEE